jgi:uncharacterized small protein (DUF1192 family)
MSESGYDLDKVYEDGRVDGINEMKTALAAKQAEIDKLKAQVNSESIEILLRVQRETIDKLDTEVMEAKAEIDALKLASKNYVKETETMLHKKDVEIDRDIDIARILLHEIDRLKAENAALKLCGTCCYCRDCNNLICGNNQSGLFKAVVFLYSTCDKWQGRK